MTLLMPDWTSMRTIELQRLLRPATKTIDMPTVVLTSVLVIASSSCAGVFICIPCSPHFFYLRLLYFTRQTNLSYPLTSPRTRITLVKLPR
jgi:hypothetical protein